MVIDTLQHITEFSSKKVPERELRLTKLVHTHFKADRKAGGESCCRRGESEQKSLYISLHLSNQKDIIDIIKPCSGLNSKNICCYVNIIPYDSFFVKSRSSTDRDGNFHPPTFLQLMKPSQPHTGPAGTWIMCWNCGIRKRIIQRFTTYNCLVDLYIGNFNVRSTPKF